MPLPISVIHSLASACAPAVSPTTLAAIIQAESGGDPLAIGINGPAAKRLHPSTREEAIREATLLIAKDANIDLGLGQINIHNLAPLGMSVVAAFDPCRNLASTAAILAEDYTRSVSGQNSEQAALRTSLSLYNTGDRQRGFHNGYVAKVEAAARQVVPALQVGASLVDNPPPSEPPAWDVFGETPMGARNFIFSPVSGKQP